MALCPSTIADFRSAWAEGMNGVSISRLGLPVREPDHFQTYQEREATATAAEPTCSIPRKRMHHTAFEGLSLHFEMPCKMILKIAQSAAYCNLRWIPMKLVTDILSFPGLPAFFGTVIKKTPQLLVYMIASST